MSTNSPRGQRHSLKFRSLRESFAIVRLEANAAIPDWANHGEFNSISRTADELSIVCAATNIPSSIRDPQRWMCLKLEGPFPFSLTGILPSFIQPLSDNAIPIFAVSTYDTDYVLIQEEFSQKALAILRQAGHELKA
ncbi:MAG: ACT domain-containing protein [Candidatus Sulfotelmatobacter sp.]|jgi:hypothetical protein